MGAGWCRAAACARGDSKRSAGGVGMLDKLRARRFLAALPSVSGLGLVGRWRWTTGQVLDMARGAGEGCCCRCTVGRRDGARHGYAVRLGGREEAGLVWSSLRGDKMIKALHNC